jgi:rhomboid protease GluP
MVYLLLIANVLVFLIMGASTGSFDFSVRTLLAWGGNLGELSLNGEWWRLLTATYLHGGFQHILGNMVLLLIVGTLISRKIGELPFLIVYTICGVAASTMSAAGHPDVVSVGASGAIAGIMGAACILAASDRCPEIDGKWLTQTLVINALYSFAPSVDWLAHLGGFLAGLVCGVVLLVLPGAIEEPYVPQ